MPYTLDAFTRQVPPALLIQAQAHVAAGQVRNLEHVGIEWLADVVPAAGESETYSVSVAVGPKGELLATCTCNDDENDLCRHAIAMLLEIVKQEPQAVTVAKPGAKARKPAEARKPAKTSAIGRLRTALEEAPHDTLVNMLIDVAKGDKHLQNHFFLQVVDVSASLETFDIALKQALSPRGGVNAWYDARSSKAAAKQVGILLDRAERAGTEGDIDKAMRMVLKVHEATMALLSRVTYCDPIESCADRALNSLVSQIGNVSAVVRREIFNSLVETGRAIAGNAAFGALGLKKVLVALVTSPEEREIIQPLLKPPTVSRSYYAVSEEWDVIVNAHYVLQYVLAERLDGERAAEEFAADHIRFFDMRRILIEHAVARGDAKTIEKLAFEGLALSDKAKRAEASAYYRTQLLAIAPTLGAKLADVLLSEFFAKQTSENYLQYKSAVLEKEWHKARTRLLKDPKLQPDFAYFVYHMDEMWRELMDFLKKRISNPQYVIEALQYSGTHLVAAMPKEVADWCTLAIAHVERRKLTSHPQHVAVVGILKEMHKLGLHEQSAAIAARLRKEYANQASLITKLKDL